LCWVFASLNPIYKTTPQCSGATVSKLSPLELHALSLGKLLGNLQTIETGTRLFLAKADMIPELKKGDWAELTPLTNNLDLRRVLEKYNKAAKNCRVVIDRIVNLRDALAHGRVFGRGPIQNVHSLRLLKFKRKAEAKKVQVEIAEEMTEGWFKENIEFLLNSLEKIRTALDWDKTDLSIKKP